MTRPADVDYQPLWCEENVWRLCGHERFAGTETLVVIVTSPFGTVRIRHQRAADGGVVDWDYHVALLARDQGAAWLAWDLDTTLGFPVPATRWVAESFAEPIPERLRSRLRVLDGASYRAALWSDRTHMRTADGSWMSPPPPWPTITMGSTPLARLLDPSASAPGEVLDPVKLAMRLD